MGILNRIVDEVRRIKLALFSDEDETGERMIVPERTSGTYKKRWTWQLVANNVAVVVGTAFMCGFTFPAFVRLTALSPHQDWTQQGWTDVTPNYFNGMARRKSNFFTAVQMFAFYTAKLIAFLGVASAIGNKFGRRKALMCGAIIGFVGLLFGLVSAYVSDEILYPQVTNASDVVWTIGAFLLGLQNGISQVVTPALLIETAPTKLRGACGVLYEGFFWIGFVAAFIIEIDLFESERQLWHVVIGGALFVYAAHFVAMWFAVESPRWLIHEKRDVEAKAVLQKLRQCSAEEAEAELNDIKLIAEQTGSASFSGSQPGCCDKCCCGSKLFSAKVMWPVFLGACLMSANYLTGAPLIFQFQTSILTKTISYRDSPFNRFLPAIAVLIIFIYLGIMACCALAVDRIGRRRLVLFGLSVMIVSYLPIAIGVYLKVPIAWQIGSVLFMAAYSLGPGPISTFMIGEFFDQSTRLSATSICHLVTQFFPLMWLELYASHPAYGAILMPGGILLTVVEMIILALFLPETMKLPIERVVEKFETGRRKLQVSCRRRAENEQEMTVTTEFSNQHGATSVQPGTNWGTDNNGVAINATPNPNNFTIA